MSDPLISHDVRRIIVCSHEAGMRLDHVLKYHLLDVSRVRIQALIHGGQVTLEGEERSDCHPSDYVRSQDVYKVSIPRVAEEAGPVPQDIPLEICFEDEDIIVVNKPAGMVVHPAPGHPDQTLVNALLFHCGDQLSGIGGVRRPGIVHRLDQGTSGLMVVAKHDHAHTFLSRQFEKRTLSKVYKAFVWGRPTPLQGTIDRPIGRHPHHRQKMAIRQDGRAAVTHYKVISVFESARISLVECHLETGRTHQIRVHMSAIRCPLVGDTTYARGHHKIWLSPGRQALHAERLSFIHPRTREALSFQVPLPDDLKKMHEDLLS